MKVIRFASFFLLCLTLCGCHCCCDDTLWFNRPTARDVYYQDYYQSLPIPSSIPPNAEMSYTGRYAAY